MPAPPPLPTSRRIRTGWAHWLLAAPAALFFIVGLSLMFDFTSQQTAGERGIEQSLALLILIVATFFSICAMAALLLRPYRCGKCQSKVHRRALSCANCQVEFVS